MASTTTWGLGFYDLQTPGWTAVVGGHPGGIIDLQYDLKGLGIFAEAAGDPHRPTEATGFSMGVRHDVGRKGPFHFYAQMSAGVFMAPSFLEYCGSYEYRHGDCGAGNKPPENCFWLSYNGGLGLRIQVTKKFAIEPARAEYLSPYGIGPRYRFSAGFRVGL